MAQIRPFRALRYSSRRVSLEQVVTQPYDKISPEMQERYRRRHPNNLIRILRPASEPDQMEGVSPYRRAESILRGWRNEGIIEEISKPSLFAYFQRFRLSDTDRKQTRKGFIGLTHLEDYDRRIVFPHERTLTEPKQDRLALLRHTRTHFGQVFLLYSDPSRTVDAVLDTITAENPPEVSFRDDYDVEHLLWPIADPRTIALIQDAMSDKKVVIADGHHRYETALRFRDEMRMELGTDDAGGFEWLMTTLVNMESPGMTILPTHRVVRNLPDYDLERFLRRVRLYFDVTQVADLFELEKALRKALAQGQPTIGMASVSRQDLSLLSLRPDTSVASLLAGISPAQARLDVVILHRLILERCLDISDDDVKGETYLRYVRGIDEAVNEVRSGTAQMCFLLNATRMDQVRDIALAGELLPQKSTDFFPKLLSGLTMYCMEEAEGK